MDGEPITYRELQSENGGAELEQSEALSRAIARKVLAQEAEALGLDRDGEFHFSLRRVREELLVDALRGSLRAELVPTANAMLDTHLAEQPWRYSERFILSLAPADAAPSAAPNSVLDSALLFQEPAAELLAARPGDIVVIDDVEQRVVERSAVVEPPQTLRRRARRDLLENLVYDALQARVTEYRQSGRIRYQHPTAEGPTPGRSQAGEEAGDN